MLSDLWNAITSEHNRRPHPAAAAILYSFCPAAAYWYLAGALPVPPFDPAWKVLSDQAEYPTRTFKTWLAEWGLSTLEPDLQNYVATVRAYRRNNFVPAPETSHAFRFAIPAERRFGLQNPINDHFGGQWENLLEYVRVWVFVV